MRYYVYRIWLNHTISLVNLYLLSIHQKTCLTLVVLKIDRKNLVTYCWSTPPRHTCVPMRCGSTGVLTSRSEGRGAIKFEKLLLQSFVLHRKSSAAHVCADNQPSMPVQSACGVRWTSGDHLLFEWSLSQNSTDQIVILRDLKRI